MPKVSVIMPVYNSSKYLEETLNSILSQTLKDIEIICINDASTDSSLDILKAFSKKDSRIKIINNDKNSGPGYSRNLGIELANGEYLEFLDSDDIFEKDMLEICYNECIKEQIEIAILPVDSFNTATNKKIKSYELLSVQPSQVFNYKNIGDYFYTMICGWACDKFIKSSFVKKNSIRFAECKLGEDMGFNYTAISLAKRMKYIKTDKCLYHYRRNIDSSLSGSAGNIYEHTFVALKYIENELKSRGIYEKFERNFINLVNIIL